MTEEPGEPKDPVVTILKKWTVRVAATVALLGGILSGVVTVTGKWAEVRNALGFTGEQAPSSTGLPVRESSPREIETALSGLGPVQREKAFAAGYVGRAVNWTGMLVDVTTGGNRGGYRVAIAIAGTETDVLAYVAERDVAMVENLRVRDAVNLKGRISGRSGSGAFEIAATGIERVAANQASTPGGSSDEASGSRQPDAPARPSDAPAISAVQPQTSSPVPSTPGNDVSAEASAAPGAAATAPVRTKAAIREWQPPRYPPQEMRRKIQGSGVLRMRVGADGLVRDVVVEVSSGSKYLDDAAVKSALAAVFTPATENGAPVEDVVSHPFRFALSEL